MKKRTIAIIALLILFLTGISLTIYSRRQAARLQDIVLAVSPQILSAPLYVAQEKGFFQKEGLHVTFQSYTTGVEALNTVINGRAHFGNVADTPLMLAGLKGEPIYIIATISNSNDYVIIVARKDSGITGPESLKGKKVGIKKGTSSEYFLYAYLNFNGMKREDVRMIDMKFENMADALVQGDIDAASAWEPHTTNQKKILGNDAITLKNNYVYMLYWNLVGRQDFIKRNPETVVKLLRALMNATDYMKKNPDDAQKIMSRIIGREHISLANCTFDVHLAQSLIDNLEDQARWAIDSGLTDKRQVPNYVRMMYLKGLESVKPEAVTVIRK